NTGASDSLIGELLAWEQKWEDKFQALKKYFKEAHPKYFQLKYGRTPISLDQINRFLTPNQDVLEFFVRNNQLTWFLFAQDLAIWEVMELDSDLNQALRDFREGTNTVSAQSNDFERLVRASHRVYQRLLAKPIQALKDHKDQHWRLSIINDGPLHFISWASALPQLPSPNLMNDPSGWDFLVKDRSLTLSQQHSLQIAMATQAPAKDTYENRYGAVGAWYADRDIPEGRKAIEHIIRSEAWANSSEAYLGSPSAPLTASLFWDLGGKSQIFHISGHGLPNWNNPMQSRILLSSTDSITVGDFYQRSLPSRLVILDACEMNLGPAMEGEGVMSFATGIFYAGPPTVLASLWQVEEKASAFLIPAFLDGINEGLAVDVAWQNAQIKFLHEYRGNKHPFYWASITSIGNMAPLYAPGRKRIWLFSGLALVLLLGGWWLWGQRTGAKD
ncbi:MAG: CHAT domain-containing protein, partial [Bacteroidota bacterium]